MFGMLLRNIAEELECLVMTVRNLKKMSLSVYSEKIIAVVHYYRREKTIADEINQLLDTDQRLSAALLTPHAESSMEKTEVQPNQS